MRRKTSPNEGNNSQARINRTRATPVDRVLVYPITPNPLIITKNEVTNTVSLQMCCISFGFSHIVSASRNAIASCFTSTNAHPYRLTYCTAGLMFHATSPLPFWGSKQSPGYSEFLLPDNSNNQLLDFLVSSAMKSYWKLRGPTALNFLVESVNRVLALQFAAQKDVLDELLLKGMKKTGQIPWFGPAQIPEHLQHRFENRWEDCVLFTPASMRQVKQNGSRW